MPAIHCKATPFTIGSWTILKLPDSASKQLPSRGQVMIKGTINDVTFQAAFEPDGKGGHWCEVDKKLQKSAEIRLGESATLSIEATKDWPEPPIPTDVQTALDADQDAYTQWKKVTPMARWEWLRWIGSTNQPETRERRIEVSRSKLRAGERRPCCFNRSMCCVPEVSKNGILLEPGQKAA